MNSLTLCQGRREKAERIKDLGTPIRLAGKALAVVVSDGNAWIGENTAVAKKLDLEVDQQIGHNLHLTQTQSGKVLQIYRGHTGPVSALTLFKGPDQQQILVTGSWDKVESRRPVRSSRTQTYILDDQALGHKGLTASILFLLLNCSRQRN